MRRGRRRPRSPASGSSRRRCLPRCGSIVPSSSPSASGCRGRSSSSARWSTLPERGRPEVRGSLTLAATSVYSQLSPAGRAGNGRMRVFPHYTGGGPMANVPQELLYTSEHEYVRKTTEEGVVVVGITDFAQDQLGDVVFVELPAPGARFSRMDVFGTIEAVKAVSELFCPLD